MHYHSGVSHIHEFDDPEHEHEMASEYERIHGLRFVEGQETFDLNSVGIDIGSSTSHLMFSKLTLMRIGGALSSRFEIVQRDVTYASPILLTPYVDGSTIDVQALGKFIAESYAAAGVDRDGVDAGAVIATGEAAKKENAEAIVALFAEQAGKFVCATAGPNLEALMAAYGSGSVDLSGRTGRTVLNVDVGGGTTKLSLVQNGEVVETAAINVGARLVAMDEGGRVTRIEDAARVAARAAGVHFAMGQRFSSEGQKALAEALADALLEAIERKGFSPLGEDLLVTAPLQYAGPIDVITCSGGTSEYIMGEEARSFGDLGPLLGAAIRRRLDALGIELAPSAARIRATAIGAAQYTLQVSGTTIYVTDQELLPLHNLQVLAPHLPDEITADGVADAVRAALRRGDVEDTEQPIALALHWDREPAYRLLRALSDGIVAGLGDLAEKQPIVLAFDGDIGGMVGSILAEEVRPGARVVSVDELTLSDFDYIDVGAEIKHVQAVPVIIKSLVFRPEHPLAHDHDYLHRHGLTHDHPHTHEPAHASHDQGHDHDHDHGHGNDHAAHDHDHGHDHGHGNDHDHDHADGHEHAHPEHAN